MPMPDELVPEGRNIIYEDEVTLAAGAEGVLRYNLSGTVADNVTITYITGRRDDPEQDVRFKKIMVFRPRKFGGTGQAVDMIGQGEPHWEEIIGTAQLAFMLAAKEVVMANSTIAITVENAGIAQVIVSVTLVAEFRPASIDDQLSPVEK